MFVGGLSASTTLEDIKTYFEQFGKVSAVLNIVPIYPNFLLSLAPNGT